MKTNLVYMTAGSKEEARTIGKELVTSRLVACVNIIDHMNSFYMWEGELQDDNEVIIIAKTTEDRVADVVEKIKAMHSYDCPCVISLPILGGNSAYLSWIEEEVEGAGV